MEKLVRRILMPVILDAEFLPVIKQVAALVESHNAELHLLYVGDPAVYKPQLWWFHPKVIPLGLTSEKMALLQMLKEIICREHDISVVTAVEWGKWRTTVLNHAVSIGADLLVLNETAVPKTRFPALKSNLEYILEKSHCQVITLFAAKAPRDAWKQVVIPITDFVPELRLRTIMDTAISQKMKIHLVTVGSGETSKRSTDFYFLTETLKRLKIASHLQVECKCLDHNYSPLDSFLSYARSVGADLLMTRMSAADKEALWVKDLNFHVA